MKSFGLLLAGLVAAGAVNAATLQRGPAAQAAVPVSAPTPLGARAIAQMDDNTPVALGGVSCSDTERQTTSEQSWWRRFYLSEHGSPSSVRIESVTVGAETGRAPVTIRLYSIPHSVPVDTLPTAPLQLIGTSQTVVVNGQMGTVTIPVKGLLADAVGHDLVVEYHTDFSAESAFYPGGNASAESHASFISAVDCSLANPVTTVDAGFPDAHMIIVANAAAPAVDINPSFAPAVIAGGAVSRLEIALLNPLPSAAALTSAFGLTLPASLVVAPTANATTTCGGNVAASSGGSGVSLNGATIPASGSCTLAVDVTSAGGVFDLAIPAGALQTSQGANAHAVGAHLTVIPAGGNGVIPSGPLNRRLYAGGLGTSYDMVGNEFTEAAMVGGNWDVNFGLTFDFANPVMVVLGFNTGPTTEFMLDDQGRVAALGNGDVVGPTALFAAGQPVPANPAWYGSTDAAVGVRFRCAGRLAYPVVGGDFCYGYLRVATTAPAGVPARLVESALQGDGAPITVQLAGGNNPPSASTAPAVIHVSVAANAISAQEFELRNAAGSQPLRYATSGRGIALAARPDPTDLARPGGVERATLFNASLLAQTPLHFQEAVAHDPVPWSAPGGFLYVLDDGVMEGTLGLGTDAGIWLNRFSVIEAQTINSLSFFWPAQSEGGSVLGLSVNLLAYYDADGDGDPRNAVRLGGDQIVTIDKIDAFQTYPTQFVVPGAGDVYVGFIEQWAVQGHPAQLYAGALDNTNYNAASYVSINMPSPGVPANPDIDNLGANQMTGLVGALGMPANFMFRATGDGPSCSGAPVSWLRIDGRVDQLMGGAAARLNFQVDPAAGDLAPGNYSAELCIVTNDPAHRVLSVPVTAEVTAPAVEHPCSTTGDGLFCAGFESDAGAIVRSGLLDVELPPIGLSFNLLRGDWGNFSLNGDDFAPFNAAPIYPFMLFYWQGDLLAGRSGAVADTVFGPYRVLRSGDTVGPDSIFSEVANAQHSETRRFLEGVDGYLGVRFLNEETHQINYGYIHLRTTWPSGYPAKVIGYGYNREGGPVTIP